MVTEGPERSDLKNWSDKVFVRFLKIFVRELQTCNFTPSIELSPSIETHLALVRGLPTKNFLPECVNEKSSTERRS